MERDFGMNPVKQEKRFGGIKLGIVFAGLGVGTALAAMGLMEGAATPAYADEGNSTPGIDRYIDNLGRQQATEVGAQCDSGAGSGAFGYLGKDLNPGEPTWDGGNGTEPGTTAQTGINNSAVCGNRQGNLP